MNPLLLAVAFIIGGLVIMYLSPGAKNTVFTAVLWWIGLAVAALGTVIVLAPVLMWVRNGLISALGA